MGPEGNILENSSISTFQQGLTHSAMVEEGHKDRAPRCERGASMRGSLTELQPFFLRMWVTADLLRFV